MKKRLGGAFFYQYCFRLDSPVDRLAGSVEAVVAIPMATRIIVLTPTMPNVFCHKDNGHDEKLKTQRTSCTNVLLGIYLMYSITSLCPQPVCDDDIYVQSSSHDITPLRLNKHSSRPLLLS